VDGPRPHRRAPPAWGAPDRKAAHEAFEQLCTGALSELPWVNPLRDFLVDEAIRYAGQQDLVVAVHTGYWGDFRTLDPLHMIPVLERHRGVRFDVYHLGYPWMRESLMLGKGFPNVWLNFCWTHIISQKFAMDALDEAIDLVPMSKLLAFGGDYATPVEKVYGHLQMALEGIANVLAGRVEDGWMTEEEALRVAHAWLWDNPVELYRLEV
jgi:predicted TIM-barrel fold metal-dependent hydrolase